MNANPAAQSAIADPANLFGAWELSAASAEGTVSFAAPGAPAETEGLVWRMDLPADSAAAQAQLDAQLARMKASEAALPTVQARVRSVAARAKTAASEPVSFAATPLEGAEGELLTELAQLRPAEGMVEFGLLDSLKEKVIPPAWGDALQKAQPLLDRVQNAVLYSALVETRIAGQHIARTTIGWAGDANTAWGHDAHPDDLALHARALALAIASRHMLTRIFMLTARLAVTLSAPGGPVLALPAAWKFINQVLAEVRQYQELAQA